MVQVFRCRICGEAYIGNEAPTQCPFCGALQKYLLLASSTGFEWKTMFDVELSEISRNNMKRTLELEIDNATFYLCVAKTSKSEEIKAMFKILSKVEKEHAEIASKILKLEMPAIEFKPGVCSQDDRKSIEESLEREKRAVRLYTEFLGQAQEPRLKEIFQSLVEIESDHISLDKAKLEKIGQA
jgi:rubrerythrin